MGLEPRQKYIFGGIAKSVKKAVKGVTSGIKDIVSSDVGKMALLAAGGAYAAGLGPFASGSTMFGGKLAGLKGAGFLSNLSTPSFLTGATDAITKGGAFTKGAAILGGSALLTELFGGPQQAQELYSQSPEKVSMYLRQYYKNINPKAEEKEIDAFVQSQTSGLAAGEQGSFAKGGRVGLEDGGMGNNMEDLPRGLQIDTTTYSLGEDPQFEEITIPKKKPMDKFMLNEVMGDKGMNTLSEDTRDLVMRMYAEKAYKNGEISEEEYREIMGLKDGGMPTGIMRLNKAGVKERDYREEGGFVPVGIKEKADDVPAMLSKNEFVMTADAVRGAGKGDVEKGAQRMYRVMKTLENGGSI